MYDSSLHRDLVKAEVDYRVGRARSDLAGRRRRRSWRRHGEPSGTTLGVTR